MYQEGVIFSPVKKSHAPQELLSLLTTSQEQLPGSPQGTCQVQMIKPWCPIRYLQFSEYSYILPIREHFTLNNVVQQPSGHTFFSGYEGHRASKVERVLLILCLWSAPCALANTFTQTRIISTFLTTSICIIQWVINVHSLL